MVTCAVYGCCNRGNQRNSAPSDVTFHIFPKDPQRKRKWVRALLHTSNSQQTSSKTCTPDQSRICSAHFEDKYFDRTGVKVRLRKDAVPTIFPEVEDTVAALFSEANNPFKGKLKVAFHEDPKMEHKTAENETEIWNSPKKLPPKKALLKRTPAYASPTTNKTAPVDKAITQTPVRKISVSPRQKTSASSSSSSTKDKPTTKKQQAVIKNKTTPQAVSSNSKTTPQAVSNNSKTTPQAVSSNKTTPQAVSSNSKTTPQAVSSNKTTPQIVSNNNPPQEAPAPVEPAVVAEQEPEEIAQEYLKSPPETPQHVMPEQVSPLTPYRYRDDTSSVSVSPTPQSFSVQNGVGCESPRSFTSYYDVPVAGSEIVVTQSMIERSTSVSPQNTMSWLRQHPPLFTEVVVNHNGTADAPTTGGRDVKKVLEQKYKKKIRKLQIKKRKNLLKITSINNTINKLGNQNLLIDDRIGRIVSKLTYNI